MGEGRTAAYRQASQASMCNAARRLWNETRPLAGTPADHYLRTRGVGHVAAAAALRFHPGITHPNVPGRFPALVAGVQAVTGEFLAVHRTYLRDDGTGKADLDPAPARLSLGPIGGGAVRIIEPAGDALLMGEGIETTGAAVNVLGWRGGAWAALSTSGLRTVRIPGSIRDLVIAADRDSNGAGQRAAGELAARVEATGRTCEVWMPDRIGDFADELMEAR